MVAKFKALIVVFYITLWIHDCKEYLS